MEKKENLEENKEIKREEKEIQAQPDEIELTEINTENDANNLYKIVGEYKNPKFKPWSKVDPEAVNNALWEALKKENDVAGMVEIGDGSTVFEHHYEFWGTWRVKPGTSQQFLKDPKNWPVGVKITEVKPG